MKAKTRVYTREMRRQNDRSGGYTYVVTPCLHQFDAYELWFQKAVVVCPICRLESNVN